MNTQLLLYSGVQLFGTFISAISQVMLKKAAVKKYKSFIEEYTNPLVFFAYVIFVITTFLNIISYKVVPLSMGPILESTSYIYITFFGIKIFHENVNKKKIIALIFIITGIIIYSMFG